MRSIVKRAESAALRDWKRDNAQSPQNIHFDNLSGAVKLSMSVVLLQEQGGLCAYTMKQLVDRDGAPNLHIEHILPRSLYSEQSVVWSNLVACAPRPGVACQYGAIQKGSYDPNAKPFVNPIIGGASVQFRFRENGEVDGLTPAATQSLGKTVLHLNHADLVSDRAAKIRGALAQKPTARQARHRAQELRKLDGRGNLEPYCEAVAQVLEAYASRLDKRAKRVSGVKRK